jgi:hypothetical protein
VKLTEDIIMKMKLVQPLIIGLILLCGANYLPAKSETIDTGLYTTNDKEYYLTESDVVFLRPGLEIEILDVVVPADSQLEVTYSIKDSGGQPLDHYGVTSPGVVDMRYTLANIPMEEEQKARLAYERNSRDGTLTTIELGVYKYKFDMALSANPDTTHTLVLGGRRDLREYYLDRYADNAVYDWVPSGLSDPVPRDVVTTDTCNRCHDPLALHGSRWQEVTACSQCHNPDLVDEEGVSHSLDVMIHRVHNELEEGYPPEINDCEVCHTGGTPTENFPLVATPAAALVCDSSGVGETTLTWEHTASVEVHYRSSWDAEGTLFATGGPSGSASTGKWVGDGALFDLYDSETMELLLTVPVNATTLGCVGNAPGSFRGEPGVQHTNWLDHPSRAVCGSCHTGVNFDTGEGHSVYNLVQPDDTRCGGCHEPYTVSPLVQSTNTTQSFAEANQVETSSKGKQPGETNLNSLGTGLSTPEGLFYNGAEFDWSIRGAHTVLYKSAQLQGVVFKFLDIKNTNAGDYPTVTFSVGGKNGFYDPADMNRVRLVLNGPNDDFEFYVSETVGSSAVANGDNWDYTFTTPLPADAMGSYTVSMEGRVDVDVDYGGVIEGERDYAQNPLMAFAVTDESPMPRRTIVDNEKCESCHVNMSLHGGNRTQAQYCVTCHRPDLIDIAEVPESVNQRWMIHKIHRGEDLENGYVVIRSRGTYDFSHVEYPGDLRNCEACHVNDSQQLPTPDGLLPQITPNFWWDPVEPNSSACLSCHDSDSAAAHAYSNTSFFGEACATCHGEGKSASVDKVHAR